MGQQVFALAGQAIGGYFFGPIGAAVGGAIGGYIGGQLFNEDQRREGPRLADLKIQTSGHGNAIPIVYGTVRVAGNVIYSSDIREIPIETEQDAKGGPTITQIDFNYEVDCGIAISEGVLTGIQRIYANGVLVYDVEFGSSPQNIFASGQWVRSIVFYTGTETQLPDPTIEAAFGVGNVPGYRGTAYVMLLGVQLNVLQTGTIPNFEFVVVRDGSIQQYIRKVVVDNQSFGGGSGSLRVVLDNNIIRVNREDSNVTVLYDLDGNLLGSTDRTDFEVNRPATQIGTPFGAWLLPGEDTGAEVLFHGNLLGVSDVQVGNDYVTPLLGSGVQLIAAVICADQRSIILLTTSSTFADEWFRVEWDGEDLSIADQGTIDSSVQIEDALGGPSALFNFYLASFAEADGRHIWIPYGAGNLSVELLEIGGDNVMRRAYLFNGIAGAELGIVEGGGFVYPTVYADLGIAVVASGDALFVFSRIPEILENGMAVADIIRDLCVKSNITSYEVDVTDINSICDGFVIGHTMTARAAIEMLRPAYFFDAVDGIDLKFVERGGASSGTFEYLDLGAGHDKPKDVVVSSDHQQERELPSRVNVKYIASSADYQVSSQSARRETTPSKETLELPLAIVMTDDYAAQVADVVLRDAWVSAATRSFCTAVEYAEFEPTDVVEVDDGRTVRTGRISKRIDSGHLIEWEAIDEDVAVYDSNAIGSQLQLAPQTLILQGPSAYQILDLPPLTDLATGNESAAYVAARGFLSNWAGARIDISRNSGVSYETGTVVSTESIMGVALTELPDFLGGNVFDEASTVRVDVGTSGVLTSGTHTELLNGENGCVIGQEILQFRTATVVTTGVYDLSGFLRGRKGTEQYISEHASGDKFVLLTVNLGNVPLNLTDRLNSDLLFRGTTAGLPVQNGTVKQVDVELARLKPYSPVHLSAVRNLDGSWYLSWERRDRYMNDWNDGVDVPMSEVSELYDIEIYNVGAELVDTYTDVDDQFLDLDPDVLGGSPTQASINFSVYQKSAVVGRGFEANKTITQAL